MEQRGHDALCKLGRKCFLWHYVVLQTKVWTTIFVQCLKLTYCSGYEHCWGVPWWWQWLILLMFPWASASKGVTNQGQSVIFCGPPMCFSFCVFVHILHMCIKNLCGNGKKIPKSWNIWKVCNARLQWHSVIGRQMEPHKTNEQWHPSTFHYILKLYGNYSLNRQLYFKVIWWNYVVFDRLLN